MTLRDDIKACTPRLRRYARALATGTPTVSRLADDLVQDALQRTSAECRARTRDLTIRLYATLTQLHREAAKAGRCAYSADNVRSALGGAPPVPAMTRQSRLATALMSLPIEEREALLLVTLEGFGHADAARILRISRGALLGRLGSARRMFDQLLGDCATARTSPPRPVAHLRLVT